MSCQSAHGFSLLMKNFLGFGKVLFLLQVAALLQPKKSFSKLNY
ncbi:unnamed protein product, partial [Staurois parvus]